MATCPECGSATITEAVAGQCPCCLLGMAAGADDGVGAPCFDPVRRQVGDYVLQRPIGAGGMGVVYEARRLADDRKVAIKLIRDSHVASPVQLRRFTMEAETVARLDHPNIVRIHEVGDGEGPPFFSMDFIEGESLARRMADFRLPMADSGPSGTASLSPSKSEIAHRQTQIAGLVARIARAVHHAHDRGVLHRDLKPGNILIDAEGEPHLTDFGLAKMLQHGMDEAGPRTLTASGDVPGTPSYMSPEQVSGTNVGPASDIHGLGAVLYALLTGRPPFQGPTPLDVFKQIVEQAPARPRSLNSSIHPNLETICLKCLEKDPLHRYSTAGMLAEDLENFAAGRSIRARRSSRARRTQQWIQRNLIGTALIASLCLGLLAALGLLKIVNDQRRAVELDRDEAFDEGMQKISQIWRDPHTKSVTIPARELAILAGRSPAGLARARVQLTLGVSANDGPSSMAQRYARLLGGFHEQMERALGEKVAFHLRLLKRFNQNEETLARGEVDFIVLSGVDFLQAERLAPGVVLIGWANTSREGVIFTGTNSGVRGLDGLRGRSFAFPDPDLSLTVWAKARLFAAGLRANDLGACNRIGDQGLESGQAVVSTAETIKHVLRGEAEVAVTHQAQFERYRHLGLVLLDQFPETPNVLAARAGLRPALLKALRNVIASAQANRAWPDGRFVSDAPGERGGQGGTVLEALHAALQNAEAFDQPVARGGFP